MVFEIVLESAQWALLEAEHSSTVYSTFISTVLQFSSGKSTCSYFKSSVAVNHLASHFPTAGTLGSSLSWQPLMQLSCFFLQTDRQTQTQQSWTCCWWQQSSCSGHLQQARTCRRWRSSSALYKYFANKNTHVICACTYPTTKHMVLNEIHFILRKN